MRIAIVVNLTKEKAIACAHEIISVLRQAGAEPLMPPECEMDFSDSGVEFAPSIEQLFETADAAVTVGGDGTIIHAAKYAAPTDTPLIGVNVGRLGFAADVETDEIGDLKKLVTEKYNVEERILLNVEVQTPAGAKSYLAVNDAVVTHAQLSKIVDFSLFLDV